MAIEKERINEDKWFTENEEKLLKEAKARRQKMLAEQQVEADKKLKELHWMHCPKCGHAMETKKIETIEVDQCKKCTGIFFDAGELDALMLAENSKRKSFFRKIVSPLIG